VNITEAKTFSNIAATTLPFNLKGGLYTLTATATFGGGSVAVQILGPDNATWLAPLNTAGSANTLTAAGQQQMNLPGGQYRISIVTATAVHASLASVPS